MNETTKRMLRAFLPSTPKLHRILAGQLAGAKIVMILECAR